MSFFETMSLNDAVLLANATPVAATGYTAPVDSAGFGSLNIQFSGAGTIEAQVLGSNDGVNYDIVLVKSYDEVKPKDTIGQLTSYFFDVTFRYYVINIVQYSGAITYNVLGRAMHSPSIAENITNAFEADGPLYVNVAGGLKVDSMNGIILSDGIAYPINCVAGGQTTFIFPTTGYQSFLVQNVGATGATLSVSNDGINFFNPWLVRVSDGVGNTTGSIQAALTHLGACGGRFIKIVMNAPSYMILVLKYGNMITYAKSDIATIAGAGVPGPGVAATANPIPAGSVDTVGLTRKLLSDTSGRLILSPAFPGTTIQNGVGSLGVQDVASFEGQTQIELLAQILLELRILNQNIYGMQLNDVVAPEMIRNEQTVFNQ